MDCWDGCNRPISRRISINTNKPANDQTVRLHLNVVRFFIREFTRIFAKQKPIRADIVPAGYLRRVADGFRACEKSPRLTAAVPKFSHSRLRGIGAPRRSRPGAWIGYKGLFIFGGLCMFLSVLLLRKIIVTE
jgi:hypothetical protein